MEHPSISLDSGKKSTGTTTTALGVAAMQKGKVSSGRTSSFAGRGSSLAADLISDGHRSSSAAGVVPVGCGSSPAAAVLRVGRRSGPATPLFPSGNSAAPASSSMAASGSAESSPIGCFNSHGDAGFKGSTTSPSAGFPFPPSPSQAWWGLDSTSPRSSSFPRSDPTWDKDTQGGFMRYFGSQPHNFHLVGAPAHNSHVNVSIPETNGGSSASEVELLSEQQPVLVNDENENVRTEKRIMWTPKEDERLMSAWIENSTDSATGADRKGEAYWGDVIKAYNKETPPQRKRNAKKAKDRWHKINRWCDLFESDYLKARRVFTSGYNDQMWMDAAETFYLDHKLGPFTIKNVWKICRDVAKWKTYNEELKNARKRKSYHLEEEVENVESEDEMPKRPPGQKAAKREKGKSKAMGDDVKSKVSAIDVEKLDKWSKIQEEAAENRMKVLEQQQKLSSDKIETTRLAHLTAQENRESKKLEMEGRRLEMEAKKLEMEGKKFEKESRMMEAYNNLIIQDTGSMTADEKAERVAAMKCLRKMLFPEAM